jgi:hypothetical protein
VSLRDEAERITAGLMAQREAWIVDQAKARGVTVQQLAATHDLEIRGPAWGLPDSSLQMVVTETLRLVPKTA